ncbi:S-adenosyl-L-methionine-dependent methyltransferase [Atractiella rhizophila]|nr:S-adenosyl-L-methionine-dependent methyltransferase [Atractiella rhizophila]
MTIAGRVLRLLCTKHFFKEVRPDVFANNRLSVSLSTGKDFDVLKNQKTGDVYQYSAYLSEMLRTPELSKSYDVKDTGPKLANRFDGGMWEWFSQHENLQKRFNMAMIGTKKFGSDDEILGAYEWASLPAKSTIVDVGGGLGHQVQILRRAHPQLHCLVQDLPQVVKEAEEYWRAEDASALASKEVQVVAGSFFDEIIPKDKEVYFMRQVLHDWSREDCLKILRNVHQAMPSKKSRLIILDRVVRYCSPASTLPLSDAYQPPLASSPLLSNFGAGVQFPYTLDLQMMAGVNGEERTFGEWRSMLEEANFTIERCAVHSQ